MWIGTSFKSARLTSSAKNYISVRELTVTRGMPHQHIPYQHTPFLTEHEFKTSCSICVITLPTHILNWCHLKLGLSWPFLHSSTSKWKCSASVLATKNIWCPLYDINWNPIPLTVTSNVNMLISCQQQSSKWCIFLHRSPYQVDQWLPKSGRKHYICWSLHCWLSGVCHMPALWSIFPQKTHSRLWVHYGMK